MIYIKKYIINFDAEHSTCSQCINNCECFDNFFNQKNCLIKQNNEGGNL